jgi:hypothetical protein
MQCHLNGVAMKNPSERSITQRTRLGRPSLPLDMVKRIVDQSVEKGMWGQFRNYPPPVSRVASRGEAFLGMVSADGFPAFRDESLDRGRTRK